MDRGFLRPSSWMRFSQVVPNRNAETTSVSAVLGSSVHFLEKRLM